MMIVKQTLREKAREGTDFIKQVSSSGQLHEHVNSGRVKVCMFEFDDDSIQELEYILMLQGSMDAHLLLDYLPFFVRRRFGESNVFASRYPMFFEVDRAEYTIVASSVTGPINPKALCGFYTICFQE